MQVRAGNDLSQESDGEWYQKKECEIFFSKIGMKKVGEDYFQNWAVKLNAVQNKKMEKT